MDLISKVTYQDYLCLDEILNAQRPMSTLVTGKLAHDELLFITIHQSYELWFKQLLHEVDSVRKIMTNVPVANSDLYLTVQRLKRVVVILGALVSQLEILETMTPLSFLEFRDVLGSSSGFQSYQFRVFETRLGLKREQRMNYGRESFCTRLTPEQGQAIRGLEQENSLFDVVESWLERAPLIEGTFSGRPFNFWEDYKKAITAFFADEREKIKTMALAEEDTKRQLEGVAHSEATFVEIINSSKYQESIDSKKRRLSHKAMIAAIMINLYQEEPMFHLPFELLTSLVEIDNRLRQWRYRHAMMVHRMLGLKIGTGGSSGFHYLKATASRHMIFTDYFDLSMFLIPRQYLPPLFELVRKDLGFAYEHPVLIQSDTLCMTLPSAQRKSKENLEKAKSPERAKLSTLS